MTSPVFIRTFKRLPSLRESRNVTLCDNFKIFKSAEVKRFYWTITIKKSVFYLLHLGKVGFINIWLDQWNCLYVRFLTPKNSFFTQKLITEQLEPLNELRQQNIYYKNSSEKILYQVLETKY